MTNIRFLQKNAGSKESGEYTIISSTCFLSKLQKNEKITREEINPVIVDMVFLQCQLDFFLPLAYIHKSRFGKTH